MQGFFQKVFFLTFLFLHMVEESDETSNSEKPKDTYKRIKDYSEDFINLKRICDAHGCTGDEKKIRAVLKEIITPYVDSVEIDSIGNLFGIIKGESDFKVMFDAHMDEIGFIVKFIDSNGYIRVFKVGGQNIRILPGSKVVIHGYSGREIPGIIGEKSIHLMNQEERKKMPDFDRLFIDIGVRNREEAEALVTLGDYVTFNAGLERFAEGDRIYGKALDDRVACYIVYEVLKRIRQTEKKPKYTIIAQFSTQEEIGTRGATVGTYSKTPDLAVIVDMAHAIDYPGTNKQEEGETTLGKGPEVSVGPNLNPKITKVLIETAKKHNIPIQIGIEPGITGTNARAIQMTKHGIACALVAPAVRYMHTSIETADMNDIELTIQLLLKLLEEPLPLSYIPD